MKIEIKSKTFGKFTINGIEKILIPGDKCTIDIREGDLLKIEIDSKSPFEEEQIKYLYKQQTLFNNDT